MRLWLLFGLVCLVGWVSSIAPRSRRFVDRNATRMDKKRANLASDGEQVRCSNIRELVRGRVFAFGHRKEVSEGNFRGLPVVITEPYKNSAFYVELLQRSHHDHKLAEALYVEFFREERDRLRQQSTANVNMPAFYGGCWDKFNGTANVVEYLESWMNVCADQRLKVYERLEIARNALDLVYLFEHFPTADRFGRSKVLLGDFMPRDFGVDAFFIPKLLSTGVSPLQYYGHPPSHKRSAPSHAMHSAQKRARNPTHHKTRSSSGSSFSYSDTSEDPDIVDVSHLGSSSRSSTTRHTGRHAFDSDESSSSRSRSRSRSTSESSSRDADAVWKEQRASSSADQDAIWFRQQNAIHAIYNLHQDDAAEKDPTRKQFEEEMANYKAESRGRQERYGSDVSCDTDQDCFQFFFHDDMPDTVPTSDADMFSSSRSSSGGGGGDADPQNNSADQRALDKLLKDIESEEDKAAAAAAAAAEASSSEEFGHGERPAWQVGEGKYGVMKSLKHMKPMDFSCNHILGKCHGLDWRTTLYGVCHVLLRPLLGHDLASTIVEQEEKEIQRQVEESVVKARHDFIKKKGITLYSLGLATPENKHLEKADKEWIIRSNLGKSKLHALRAVEHKAREVTERTARKKLRDKLAALNIDYASHLPSSFRPLDERVHHQIGKLLYHCTRKYPHQRPSVSALIQSIEQLQQELIDGHVAGSDNSQGDGSGGFVENPYGGAAGVNSDGVPDPLGVKGHKKGSKHGDGGGGGGGGVEVPLYFEPKNANLEQYVVLHEVHAQLVSEFAHKVKHLQNHGSKPLIPSLAPTRPEWGDSAWSDAQADSSSFYSANGGSAAAAAGDGGGGRFGLAPNLLDAIHAKHERPDPATHSHGGSGSRIELKKWHLRFYKNERANEREPAIRLFGIYREQAWASSPIYGRTKYREVYTRTGTAYVLKGSINEEAMRQDGFSAKVIHHFKDGFPSDWNHVLRHEFNAQFAANVTMFYAMRAQEVGKMLKALGAGQGGQDQRFRPHDVLGHRPLPRVEGDGVWSDEASAWSKDRRDDEPTSTTTTTTLPTTGTTDTVTDTVTDTTAYPSSTMPSSVDDRSTSTRSADSLSDSSSDWINHL